MLNVVAPFDFNEDKTWKKMEWVMSRLPFKLTDW